MNRSMLPAIVRSPLPLFLSLFLSLVLPVFATAQDQEESGSEPAACNNVEDQQPLRTVTELVAPPGAKELSTTFDLRMKKLCVPTTTVVSTRQENGRTITTYAAEPLELRTYVYPDPRTGRPTWGYRDPNTGDILVSPGPTLKMRKANEDGRGGQGLAVFLQNNLPVENSASCNSACPSGITCPVQPGGGCPASFLDPLVAACGGSSPPNNCCCVIDCTQTAPNCFHGNNTTNLHFHGTHASPQPPQDYVLLELRPRGSEQAEHSHAVHGEKAIVAYGDYQYRVDPFRHTQAEGTHWYHPHKHGSVSLQVANGLPGALVIEGSFDDWLKDLYGGRLEEKLLVLQQIQATSNLFGQGGRPQVLVNGQVKPTVPIRPGQVQRWRFVNATMQAGTQIAVYFPPGTIVRQIAMDGVRFSPLNYLCQPMYDPNPNPPCNLTPVTTPSITLSPGNRADFLVQAPLIEGVLEVERKIVGNLGGQGALRFMARDAALAPGAAEPGLVTLFVDDGDGKITAAEEAPGLMEANMPPPARWPHMPAYLRNITAAEVEDNPLIELTFEQTLLDTDQPGPQGSALTKFKINGIQYASGCVNVTTRLDVAQQWKVSNTTTLQHPFHIHTNPFQLVETNGKPFRPEPIWLDTLGLPPGSAATPGEATLRQRYEEFTGEYVLHCHFLGHEDRGMMFGVQTVCKDKPGFYGQPGLLDECSGKLTEATPQCRVTQDGP